MRGSDAAQRLLKDELDDHLLFQIPAPQLCFVKRLAEVPYMQFKVQIDLCMYRGERYDDCLLCLCISSPVFLELSCPIQSIVY